MKAFSSSILTEEAADSFYGKELAYKITSLDEESIYSILEFEDRSVIKEMELRRDFYIKLLEDQQNDVGVLTESGAAGYKLVAFLIGACIAIIGIVISMITGKADQAAADAAHYKAQADYERTRADNANKNAERARQNARDAYDTASEANRKRWDAERARSKAEYEKTQAEWDKTWAEYQRDASRRAKERAEAERDAERKKNAGSSSGSKSSSNYWDDYYARQKQRSSGSGSSGSSSSSSSSKANEKKTSSGNSAYDNEKDYGNLKAARYDDPIGSMDSYVANSAHSKADQMKSRNPYINDYMGFNDRRKYHKKVFDRAATDTQVEITEYVFPNRDICEGNLKSVQDLIDCSSAIQGLFFKIWEFDHGKGTKEEIQTTIKQVTDTLKDISNNIDEIVQRPDNNEGVTVNAKEYLSKKRDWFVRYLPAFGRAEGYQLNEFKPSPNLMRLKSELTKVRERCNKIDNTGNAAEFINPCVDLAKKFRKTLLTLAQSKIAVAGSTYWERAVLDNTQMNKVCEKVNETFNKNPSKYNMQDDEDREEWRKHNESAWFDPTIILPISESAIYEDSFFYEDSFDSVIDLREFYQAIDDNNTRLSICLNNYKMRAMNEEALIFSESISDREKFDKLVGVNEAVADKIKKAWYNAVAALKQLFSKFMEKLRANFTTTRNYLNKYKEIIMGKNFDGTEYQTQDLIKGIDRILATEVPALSLTTMDNSLDTVSEFFNKHMKTVAKNPDQADNDNLKSAELTLQDQGNFWKSYFCMQGHPTTVSGPQFQANIKKYYDFLYDISKVEKSIKKNLDDIDRYTANMMKVAGKNVDNVNNAAGNAAPTGGNQTGTPNEAAYSYLYQKWFTLNEDGILVEAATGNQNATGTVGHDNTQQQQNQQQTTANANNPNDKENREYSQNNQRTTMDTRCKTYVDCCGMMLKAKMSACEFIRNESMQIIRHHVQRFTSGADTVEVKKEPEQQQDNNQKKTWKERRAEKKAARQAAAANKK